MLQEIPLLYGLYGSSMQISKYGGPISMFIGSSSVNFMKKKNRMFTIGCLIPETADTGRPKWVVYISEYYVHVAHILRKLSLLQNIWQNNLQLWQRCDICVCPVCCSWTDQCFYYLCYLKIISDMEPPKKRARAPYFKLQIPGDESERQALTDRMLGVRTKLNAERGRSVTNGVIIDATINRTRRCHIDTTSRRTSKLTLDLSTSRSFSLPNRHLTSRWK